MPCDNYNYDYEPSGSFIDINHECFSFDTPLDVDRTFKETITFATQTYYRTNFVTPNRCCCGGGGCKPEPEPQPTPPEPGPCPPPEPTPCPEPDFPDGCFDGVYCDDALYPTIKDAIDANPCAEEFLVGCGVYELPSALSANICIKGRGSKFTFLSTEPGQKIVDDNVSILDVSFVSCGDEISSEPGIIIEGDNFFVKNSEFKYNNKRQIDIYFNGISGKASAVNCVFGRSCNYGVKASNISGLLNLTSCEFNNPVAIEILSSNCCKLHAVTCKIAGQVNYDCASAEFNGCEFFICKWKKINISPMCDTEFVSCTFDNQTNTGWKDASRDMSPIVGTHIGCKKAGLVYRLNNCITSDGENAGKTVVFLSEEKDKEPGGVFINGIEQIIDGENWGKF